METPTNQCKNKVEFKVFIWAISLIAIVLGWILVAQNNLNCKVDIYQKEMVEIQTTLAGISVDIQWIKQKLNE